MEKKASFQWNVKWFSWWRVESHLCEGERTERKTSIWLIHKEVNLSKNWNLYNNLHVDNQSKS
jgi:hypothetical protein